MLKNYVSQFQFFYAAFFFEPPAVERKTEENQITENGKVSDLQSKKTPVEEMTKSDVTKVEKVVNMPKIEKAIKDSLFATVGNKAITQSDILNEIKIILILTSQSFSEDIREQLQAGAIQSTIKRNIKKIEIDKHKSLTFNQADVNKELTKLAGNILMDLDTFENTFIANGINYSQIVDQLKTELMWNSLIFEIYKDKLKISLDEIDEQLKLFQNRKEIQEYLISEIIIGPVPKNKLKSTIKEIKNRF